MKESTQLHLRLIKLEALKKSAQSNALRQKKPAKALYWNIQVKNYQNEINQIKKPKP